MGGLDACNSASWYWKVSWQLISLCLIQNLFAMIVFMISQFIALGTHFFAATFGWAGMQPMHMQFSVQGSGIG